MELGKNVERYRKQKGLTTVELAAISGVKPQFISQIENGKRFPSLKILQNIASALDITTSELLGETRQSYPTNLKKLVDAAEGLNNQQLDIVISVVKEMNGKYKGD
jgi:transcriptional regulator with XRE-family HTH domain